MVVGWVKVHVKNTAGYSLDWHIYKDGSSVDFIRGSSGSTIWFTARSGATIKVVAYHKGKRVYSSSRTVYFSREDEKKELYFSTYYKPEEPKPPEPKPPEPKPPEPKRYKIFGYVRDNLGYVVSGALVRLDGRTTTTDGRGYYEFIMDQSGIFTLTVEKSGYEPASIPITFLGIADLRQDVTLVRKEEPKPPEPKRKEIYELVFVYKKLWYAPANAAERAAEILARTVVKVLEKLGGWRYIGKRVDESNNQIIIELEKVSSPAIPIAAIIALVFGSLVALGIIVYYAYLRKKEERIIVEHATVQDLLNKAHELFINGDITADQYYKILDALTNKITQEDIKKAEENAGLTDYLKQAWDMLKYALPIILIVSIIKAVKD